jgi:hypothetical protein
MSEIWEHDYVVFDVSKGPKVMKETLNTLGQDGWQLAAVINVGGEKLCAYLKRCEREDEPTKTDAERKELLSLWSDKSGE